MNIVRSLPAYALALTIVAGIILPDEKILRLKLLAIECGLLITISLWLMSMTLAGRWEINANKLTLAILPYVILQGIFYILSRNKHIAWPEMQRTWLNLTAFLAGANVLLAAAGFRKKIVWTWVITAGLIAAYGILQHTGGFWRVDVPKMERVMGTFGNPIFFGAFLAMSVPLTIGLLLCQGRNWTKYMLTMALCAEFIALFYTRTRASWIGTAVAVFIMGIAHFPLTLPSPLGRGVKGNRTFSARSSLVFILISICLGFIFIWTTRNVWLRDQGHLPIWRDTVRLWLHNPILGAGLGEFHIHFPAFAGEDLKAKWPQGKTIINYSHNEYLQTLAETGVAGLAALAGFVFAFIYTCLKIISWPSPYPLPQGEGKNRGFPLGEGEGRHMSPSPLRGEGGGEGEGGGRHMSPSPLRGEGGGEGEGQGDRVIAIGILSAGSAVLLQNFFSVDMRFAVSSAFFFLIAGIASSFDGKTLSFNLRATRKTRFLLAGVLAGASLYAGQKVIKSYAVKREHLLQPDFFQQKIINAASAVSELEMLTLKFPKDPLLFEKLGYVCAKEIKTNPAMAAKALAAFRRATELDPNRWGAYNNIGNIQYTMGDKDKAIYYWQRSIAIKPDQIDSRLNIGKALYVSGKLKESVEQFNEVLKLDPGNTEAKIYLRKMVE